VAISSVDASLTERAADDGMKKKIEEEGVSEGFEAFDTARGSKTLIEFVEIQHMI